MGGREEVRRFFFVGGVWRRCARVCARAGRGWARVLEVRRSGAAGGRASAPRGRVKRSEGEGGKKGRPASKGRRRRRGRRHRSGFIMDDGKK